MEIKFKYHPFIEGLRINEDGTIIVINEKELTPFVKGSSRSPRVNVKSSSYTVAKLICEAWNGPRESGNQRVVHIDGDLDNNHYTNLKWGVSATQKLTEKQHNEIVDKYQSGKKKSELSREYNVSITHISRILNGKN